MKITIDLDAIVARVVARRERERDLRRRGVTILRDWTRRMMNSNQPRRTEAKRAETERD